MPSKPKQLTSPYGTGNGAVFFESRVQASFVALMMAGGMCPGLDGCRITKVSAQNRYLRAQVDDVLVHATHLASNRQVRFYGQIKHRPAIRIKDRQFLQVIADAWIDFNNKDVFDRSCDVIALITGPLSEKEGREVRDLLELARQAGSSQTFFTQVKLAYFTSAGVRSRLDVFEHAIGNAKGRKPGKEEIFEFLKCFRLLGFDFDIQAGVSQALVQSLIGLATQKDPADVWRQIHDHVQHSAPHAGEFIADHMPFGIAELFPSGSIKSTAVITGWPFVPSPPQSKKAQRATVEVALGLLGGWEENAPGDADVISNLSQLTLDEWQERTREIWKDSAGPLDQQDGRWRCKDHRAYLQSIGTKVTSEHLAVLRPRVLQVLKEVVEEPESTDIESLFKRDRPRPQYSYLVREGLAESLAMLGSEPEAFPTLPSGLSERFATEIVRELLHDAEWKLWSALNPFLPLLAEAAPNAFLDCVERMIDGDSKVFATLCSKEGDGFFGTSRITGLLWAMETLAWPKEHFNKAVRVLAKLATQDPGGRIANRPANSLATILLPWLPKTLATDKQRRSAVKNIARDLPTVGWRLLLDLLPESRTSSSMSRKPQWRNWLPEVQDKGVPMGQYWDDSRAYSEMVVTLVGDSVDRLTTLISKYAFLSPIAKSQLLTIVTSNDTMKLSEEVRQDIWTALNKLSALHRGFRTPYAWKLTDEELVEIDAAADRVKPTKPEVRYQRLFSGDEYALFRFNRHEDLESLVNVHRSEAVLELLKAGGLELMARFAMLVKNPWQLGLTLASIPDFAHDDQIIPKMISSKHENVRVMAGAFAFLRIRKQGWGWFDTHITTRTNKSVLARLLAFLPFTDDAWQRATNLLGAKEGEYWQSVNPHPYDKHQDIAFALDKLIDSGRSGAALKCLGSMAILEKPIPHAVALRALKNLKGDERVDGYDLGKIITALQSNTDVDSKDMLAVEWKFMSVLDHHGGAQPITLSRGLADDPGFFCEVIRAMYRSEKKKAAPKEPSQHQRDIALNAYRLLSEWRVAPGTMPDGTFNPEAFTKWLEEVKRMSSESGHLESALYQIGEVSFYSPIDKETSLWPEAVCEELDRKQNDRMREGLRIEIFNSHGVHSAGGGIWYRSQAEKWKAIAQSADEHGYSYLAGTLRALSDSYFKDADQEVKDDKFRGL